MFDEAKYVRACTMKEFSELLTDMTVAKAEVSLGMTQCKAVRTSIIDTFLPDSRWMSVATGYMKASFPELSHMNTPDQFIVIVAVCGELRKKYCLQAGGGVRGCVTLMGLSA